MEPQLIVFRIRALMNRKRWNPDDLTQLCLLWEALDDALTRGAPAPRDWRRSFATR